MGSFLYDLRHAFRNLRRRPGFTVAALLCITLGIGASTAIFTLVNGVLLRPMPLRDPDRLVFAGNASEQNPSSWAPLSYPDIMSWREGQQAVQGLAGYRNVAVTLRGGDAPERLIGMGVTEGLFQTLGVEAALGRTFTREESGAGGSRVTVLTWGLWQRRFGGDPTIVGGTIDLQGEPHTVIGIMPEGFAFPWWSDLYLPLQADAAANNRNSRSLRAVGRLADGVTLGQARSELERVQSALREEYPDSYAGLGVYVNDYQAEERAHLHDGLVVLMVGVGLVLLIACVNVASLLLARAARRDREMAIRTSLGAGRRALARQLLVESLVLGGVGGLAGLAVGVAGRDLLLATSPLPQPFWMDFSLDARVAAFVVGVSLLTSLLFGMAPVLFAARAHPADLLRRGGDRHASGRKRWSSPLVGGEVALALALVVSAGAMVKGFHSLLQVDPGFDPEGVLTMRVTIPPNGYTEPGEKEVFLSQAMQQLGELHGVVVAGAVQSLPLGGDEWGQAFVAEGAPTPAPGEVPVGNLRVVHGSYFRAAGIPILAGRAFTADEISEGSRTVVVNEALAQRYWPGEDPVGKRIKFGGPDDDVAWRTVVGVARDVRHTRLDATESRPGFYLPYGTAPVATMTLLLRTQGDPALLAESGRKMLGRLAPTVPVSSVRSFQSYYDDASAQTRFYTFLMSAFSLAALVLALLGVAGIMAYVVRGRTREMGIRSALGASSRSVLGALLLQGMRPVAVGSVAGAGLAYLILRSLTSSFYGVDAADAGIYLELGGLFLATAFAAVWLPSRQASKEDPARVLRNE